MKVKVVICWLLVILVSVACHKPNQMFTPEMSDLSTSMKMYFEMDRDNIFYGDFFQVKILDGYKKIEYYKGKGDFARYTYEFVVAPLRNTPYRFKQIKMYPTDDGIYSYIVKTGIDSWMNEWVWDLSDSEYPKKKENTDFHAYVVSAMFDDRGSFNRDSANVSMDEFEKGIREIKIVIEYDLFQKDEIIVRFDEPWNMDENGLLTVAPLEEYVYRKRILEEE